MLCIHIVRSIFLPCTRYTVVQFIFLDYSGQRGTLRGLQRFFVQRPKEFMFIYTGGANRERKWEFIIQKESAEVFCLKGKARARQKGQK